MKKHISFRMSGTLAACAVATSLAHAQVSIYSFPGTANGQQSGRAVALAGDIDDDGVEDIAIGNPLAYWAGIQCGTVEIRSGRTGETIRTHISGQDGDEFGHALCTVGDYDFDGWDDLLVGAPGYDGSRGLAKIFSGKTGVVLFSLVGMAPGDNFGAAVALVGNADGIPGKDFAISAPFEDFNGWTDNGRVRVYSGSSGNLAYAFSGYWTYCSGAGLGMALAGGFDWNNDGLDDLLVGSPLYTIQSVGIWLGGAQVWCSGASPFIAEGWQGTEYDRLGWSVAALDDMNGDGKDEIAIASPYDDAGGVAAGKVEVYGAHSPNVPLWTRKGAAGAHFGFSIASALDVDSDGKRDLVVGAPDYYLLTSGRVGMVGVYSGIDGALVHTTFGKQDEGVFGYSVAGVGDLNEDGAGDYAAGEPYYDGLGAKRGLTRVFLGQAPLPASYCTGKTNSLGCVPRIGYSGAPSMSIADNFHVLASDVRNKTAGMLMWSFTQDAKPFFGGTLCIGAPIIRTHVQNSGGSSSGTDCTGSYDFHFNQGYMHARGLFEGMTLFCQYWMRDPGFAPPDTVALTEGLSFLIVP
jgi:hypothetical protein